MCEGETGPSVSANKASEFVNCQVNRCGLFWRRTEIFFKESKSIQDSHRVDVGSARPRVATVSSYRYLR